MSITVLVVGDMHFRRKHMKESLELSEKIIKKAQTIKPNFIVLLGDTLDSHEQSHNAPFRAAYSLIETLSEISKVFFIIGNHDIVDEKEFLSDKHFFGPLKYYPNVTLVDRVMCTKFNSHTFIFCPYTPTGRLIEALNSMPYKDIAWEISTCIFAHQEMRGCSYNQQVSTSGDVWDSTYPPLISGHIHEAQKIGKNIYYPGSAVQVKSNENPDKRIWKVVFDTEGKLKITKINLHIKFIKKIDMNIEDIDKFDQKLVESYYVILNLEGLRDEFKIFKKSAIYTELKKKGVNIHFIPKTTDNSDLKFEEDASFRNIFESLVQKSDENTKKAYKHLLTIYN